MGGTDLRRHGSANIAVQIMLHSLNMCSLAGVVENLTTNIAVAIYRVKS